MMLSMTRMMEKQNKVDYVSIKTEREREREREKGWKYF